MYSELDDLDLTIPWREWGPQNTRSFPDRPIEARGDTSYPHTFGMRYMAVEEGFAIWYDFNPYPGRLAASTQQENAGDPYVDVIVDAVTHETPLFTESITTWVPYRRIATMLPLSEGQLLGLDEDWIVLSSVRLPWAVFLDSF